ncbi:MAG TPA: ABC transporter permease [Nitrososphaerales archaeon]|nr:ABC transporter permease [Nitrososphaerales archaeon]
MTKQEEKEEQQSGNAEKESSISVDTLTPPKTTAHRKKKAAGGNLLSNKWFIRIVTFVVVMVLWQVVGSSINPLFFSTPVGVVLGFNTLISGTGNYSLVDATIVTLETMVVGFIIAAIFGVLLGIALGISRSLEVALNPYINAFYVTPRIALIPLIIIWLGAGFSAFVFTVFLTAVFPMIINTQAGVKNVSRSLLDTANAFGVGGMRRFRHVIVPAATPFIMAGLRLGVAEAFIGVIVAQMVLAISGLGWLITAYGQYYDTPQLIGSILVLMVIGAALTSFVQFLETRISYWKQSERAFR